MRLLQYPHPIQPIGPSLHHPYSLVDVLGVVIGSTDGVTLHVGKLSLDDVRRPVLFVEDCGGHAPEAVSGKFLLGVAHSSDCRVHRGIGHGAFQVSGGRKQEGRASGEVVQLLKDFQGLAGKRNQVDPLHFHFFSGDLPDGFVHIHLGPLGLP